MLYSQKHKIYFNPCTHEVFSSGQRVVIHGKLKGYEININHSEKYKQRIRIRVDRLDVLNEEEKLFVDTSSSISNSDDGKESVTLKDTNYVEISGEITSMKVNRRNFAYFSLATNYVSM